MLNRIISHTRRTSQEIKTHLHVVVPTCIIKPKQNFTKGGLEESKWDKIKIVMRWKDDHFANGGKNKKIIR